MKKFRPFFVMVIIIVLVNLSGCDNMGKIVKPLVEGDNFETPFDMLSHDLNSTFVNGEQTFMKVFTVEEGLGPIFNNTGCISCHPGNGRGTPDLALTRFSIGHDLIPDLGGPQFQNKAIPGAPYEVLPTNVDKSTRLPPPIFGLGLIENIPVETFLSYADETDIDGDGISGRPNWVTPPDYVPSTEVGGGSGQQFGRFSRKAQVSSLVQQVAEAFQQDIGITNDFIPEEHFHSGDTVPDPEIDKLTVMETIIFLRLLSPPPRGEITPEVESGEVLFNKIGCTSCHVPTMQTGPSPIDALNEVDVHLYSDMLLHDMGEELADNRPDGSATGKEWRTAPLWGTRLVAEFLGGTPFFLHDGRATTFEGAIRAHGGEAQKVKEAFFNLSEAEQQAVIAFLESL